MIFSEDRFPPSITCGASFVGIMLFPELDFSENRFPLFGIML
jgi:hypothetical protein